MYYITCSLMQSFCCSAMKDNSVFKNSAPLHITLQKVESSLREEQNDHGATEGLFLQKRPCTQVHLQYFVLFSYSMIVNQSFVYLPHRPHRNMTHPML